VSAVSFFLGYTRMICISLGEEHNTNQLFVFLGSVLFLNTLMGHHCLSFGTSIYEYAVHIVYTITLKMVSPRSDIETGVPIPSVDTSKRETRRRGSRVLQSSLEIAFSCKSPWSRADLRADQCIDSRSQQRHYGNIQSAPSFVDASTRSWSSNEPEPVDEEENVNEEEDEDDIDEGEGPRRRSDSISPSIFPSDPDPFQRTRISPPTNPSASVETTPKAGSVSLLKTTSNSRSNRSSSLISSKTRLESPGASNVYHPTETTPLLGAGTGKGTEVDPDGIGVDGATPNMSRRRSSTATAIKRRRANEVGQSTNGQTVGYFLSLGMATRTGLEWAVLILIPVTSSMQPLRPEAD
jgi:hypothetical protein